MNGLVNFIKEMRNCKVADLEQKRVNKELANIRSKFKDNVSGYQLKKYIAKLLYMYILGYDVDFGHIQAVNLLSSTKYSEKQIGYLAVSLMLNENSDLTKLVVHSIRKDLEDPNEVFNCLALQAVANIGARQISESLIEHIYRLFTKKNGSPFVQKKAGLCLLRLYRKFPEIVNVKDWAKDIVAVLDDSDLGVVHAAICVVTAFAQVEPDLYSGCVTKTISRLSMIVFGNSDPSYLYYKIPSPWLQVRMLRLLQYYPSPQNPTVIMDLDKIMKRILASANMVNKNQNQSNAVYAILFEAMNYAIHLDPHAQMVVDLSNGLLALLESHETNLRYLALETLTHAAVSGASMSTVYAQHAQIFQSLKDKDISIRQRALDLIYSLCTEENSRVIIEALLEYITDADPDFQEEIVLKVAILAEKHVSEYTWYVDVILKILTRGGNATSDSLWYRVIHIITNHKDLREYACYTILQALKSPDCHEVTVKIAGHILGEYGHEIVESPGCLPIEQFRILQSKFGLFSATTRGVLLSTYLKFINLFPEIKEEIVKVFEAYTYVLDMELQQRATEYLAIASLPDDAMLQAVCEEMPPFPERESALVKQLAKKVNATEDNRTWTIDEVLKPETKPAAEPGLLEEPVVQTVGIPVTIPSNEVIQGLYENLLCTSTGVLYESSIIKIGIKAEYQSNLGQLILFFKNKTKSPLSRLFIAPIVSDIIRVQSEDTLSTILSPDGQIQQVFVVELVGIISTPVSLNFTFEYNNQPQTVQLKLPIVVTKFMDVCPLNAADFFARWKQIGGPPKESQGTVRPSSGVDIEIVKRKLSSLGLTLLDGVDPSPKNACLAGIFNCTMLGKVGCLIRVESNYEHQMYRLTIRTTNPDVSTTLFTLLSTSINK